MRISIEYLNLLSSWHSGALVLLAHYFFILQKLEGNWYFEGRAIGLFETVLGCLDEKWHGYIK